MADDHAAGLGPEVRVRLADDVGQFRFVVVAPPLYELDELRRLCDRAGQPGHQLEAISRLRGGTKKGVFRLSYRGSRATDIMYVWGSGEDYWPNPQQTKGGPFSHTSGLEFFEAGNRLLTDIGVRTPKIVFSEPASPEVRGDVAIVEDAGDRSLADLLAENPSGANEALSQLRAALVSMAESTGSAVGKAGLVEKNAEPSNSCESLVLERAHDDLDRAAIELPALAEHRDEIAVALSAAFQEIHARQSHSVVHGELGPEHVLVDEHGVAFLIDIEGVMHFDVEWEHAYLQIRLPEQHALLRPPGLDENRVTFYRIAQHLSLVAGPLRLLDGDFPDRDLMMNIMNSNLEELLSIVA